MLRSLRFRLPALFLLGFLFAGLVSTAIAFRLFQNYTHDRALQELRRESAGAVHLYEKEAGRASVSPLDIERATGDRLFYVPRAKGFTLLSPLDALPANTVDMTKLERTQRVEFTLRRGPTTYLAVARPIELNGHLFGALVAAKPTEELQSRLTPLLQRLTAAFGIGLLVAALLSLYLSRRIVRPLRTLSRAADEVSRGRYEVHVPEVPGRTEIAHLADRFRDMAERLAEAEELERNFLMTVSHELRTPLTAIQGHVAALREGVFDDEETRAFSLEVIDQEAARLGRLVGDVLDLAKLDAHRFTVLHEEVDMEALVERAFAAFGEEARRRSIDYRQEIRARPVIVTDGDRVLQIISNLLSNAMRWTPEGGRVEVSLASENGAIEVDVSDTGPGVTAEERERIFRPFWSRDGSGTGLGLAIARELAVALGGRIELDSRPGRGSRFRLVLPTVR